MAKRYIDADAFCDFIKSAIERQRYYDTRISKDGITVEDVLNAVIEELKGEGLDGYKNAPTADVRENVRGEWLTHDFYGEHYECSNCHCWHNYRSDFCPDCGADMRGSI